MTPATRPALIFYDGHMSHVSPTVIKSARDDDIHIVCFPPHTTHLYQPLDKGIFGPLKVKLDDSCLKLLREIKCKSLSRYDCNQVFKPAWLKAVTPANIQAGFRASGLWPLNRNAVILPCEKENQCQQGN